MFGCIVANKLITLLIYIQVFISSDSQLFWCEKKRGCDAMIDRSIDQWDSWRILMFHLQAEFTLLMTPKHKISSSFFAEGILASLLYKSGKSTLTIFEYSHSLL